MRNTTLALIILAVTGCASQPVVKSADPQNRAQSQKLLFEAITAFRAGKLATTSQAIENSLKLDPDNGLSYNVRALTRQRLGQFDDATRDFQKAIELSPNDATIRNNFGTLLCTQKHYRIAEQNFLYAADIDTNSEPEIAYTNAGLCSERAGDNGKAKQYFEKAITEFPGQPTALYHLSQLSLDSGQAIQANTYLTQYREHAPHTSKSLLLAARIEHAMGNLQGVETYINQMQSKFPDAQELRQARQLIDPITKQLVHSPTPLAQVPAIEPPPAVISTPPPVITQNTQVETPIRYPTTTPESQPPVVTPRPAVVATPITIPVPAPVVPTPQASPKPPIAQTEPLAPATEVTTETTGLNAFVTPQDITPAAEPAAPTVAEVKSAPASSPFPPRSGPVEVKDSQWILQQDARHYTLQILAADNAGRLDQLIAQDIAPDTMARFQFSRHDKVWHNLVLGNYEKNSDAQAALNALPEELKTLRPWIRPFRSLQRVIKQEGYSAFTQ